MPINNQFQYDIFISYSQIDNQSWLGRRQNRDEYSQWVTSFEESLRHQLSIKFGRKKSIRIWRDRELTGNEIFDNTIAKVCSNSALMICITSSAYMESDWCQKEYQAFVAANSSDGTPRHGDKSRVFHIRLNEVPDENVEKYENMFRHTLGYEFCDESSLLPLWPGLPNEPDNRYWINLGHLVRDIYSLLTDMATVAKGQDESTSRYICELAPTVPDFGPAVADKLMALLCTRYSNASFSLINFVEEEQKLVIEGSRNVLRELHHAQIDGEILSELGIIVKTIYPADLDEILLQASEHVILSGHTLNRFTTDNKVHEVLVHLLKNGVRVSLLMLNPASKHAMAHIPFHEYESEADSVSQSGTALEYFTEIFNSLDQESKQRLEMLLTNYMPRYRVIIVDGKKAYINMYMYSRDVSDYPDIMIKGHRVSPLDSNAERSSLFSRVLVSTTNLINAPETISYIRNGMKYEYWERSHLAQWEAWPVELKNRHRIIHKYYVVHANAFHKKFGDQPEIYVKKYLDLMFGDTMVLGCGTGKEVAHLYRHVSRSEPRGIDFSTEAIRLARFEHSQIADHLWVADFYDLDCFTENNVDSIVSNAAFVHLLQREDMEEMLRKIWNALRRGGVCFLRVLYKEHNELAVDEEYDAWVERFRGERWFVYYSREYLAQLAQSIGFSVNESVTKDIARTCNFDIDTVITKGFPHMQYEGVYWPTLLLEKPND